MARSLRDTENFKRTWKSDMVKKQIISATESQLAKRFKFSERKVRDYFKAARIGPAKYNFLECVDIFIEKANGTDDKSIEKNLNESRRKLNDAKLQILEGNYIHINDVSLLISAMLFRFKSKVLSLPKKIPPELYGKEEKQYEKVILKHVLLAAEELKEFEEMMNSVNEQYGESEEAT